MNFINKLQRKFGRYAVRNLPAIMIALYAAGYILGVFSPEILGYLTLEPYYILHGQIWRVITWVIVPPGGLGIFTIIMLFFYFSIGQALERTWGTFRFNLYIFSGVLFSVIGAFLLYAFIWFTQGRAVSFGTLFSTYYINMSIFLAFAMSYPETTVLLYFFIPVKMKWMGVLYGVMILVEFFAGNWASRVAIIASLMNFIVYYLLTRNSPRVNVSQMKSRMNYQRTVKKASPAPDQPRHRCAICGRTEKDGDHLVFRYCSQCDGAYEYCQDHLFNHQHRRA